MSFKQLFNVSSKALLANRSRSALTVLGIVIGISSIIMVMSIGKGAERLILNQIKGIGSRTISVEPGREPKGPTDFIEMFTDSLKERELEALSSKSNVGKAASFTPVIMQAMTMSYESETKRGSVIGASENLFRILDISPEEGTVFSDDDTKSLAPVAVIGNNVKEDLFGLSDAVGEKIKIKDKTFRIAGVIGEKGQVSLLNVDDMAVVPYTTAQKYLMGIDFFHSIIIEAESEEAVPEVVSDIKATLRELHNIANPEKDDFHVSTQADAAETVGSVTGVLTALLVAVAAISLLVGGIGIMNIMLVSVTERTREIGLRKALGATSKDIMSQFLLEAVLLTAAGGIMGIIFGAFLSFLASVALSKALSSGWPFVFPISAAVIGICVSAFIGVVFGIYPAKEASSKDPIEALRYE